jgi:hypothetical protein
MPVPWSRTAASALLTSAEYRSVSPRRRVSAGCRNAAITISHIVGISTEQGFGQVRSPTHKCRCGKGDVIGYICAAGPTHGRNAIRGMPITAVCQRNYANIGRLHAWVGRLAGGDPER